MSSGFALAGVTVGGGVVRRLDLQVAPGELVALVGPSLTGKTALAEVLGGWVAPEAGTVTWAGAHVPPPWSRLAVVPQEIALIEELTVGENVGLALGAARARGAAPPDDDEVVARLGIGHLWSRGGYEISVGERQRTMVARALVGRPPLVVADEPVAHQDARRAEVVLDLLRERADAGGAVVLATRDPETAVVADRVLTAPF